MNNKNNTGGFESASFKGLGEVFYFIGIGGIGMSAIVRYLHSLGKRVSGYDKTQTQLTKELEQLGIAIHYDEDIDLIPKDADVVVYTPAVPGDHKELVYYREHNYKVVKRSEVLQWITESSFNICVAGTHGKTTISTMIAHILRDTGYGCNAFLGGISVNYETNFWSSEKNVCVVEADEYDRSFLKLVPDIAVITAMDADHLDIYGKPEEVENAFIQFSKRVKPGGCLINKYGLKRTNELNAAHHYTYSLVEGEADIYAANIKVQEGSYIYSIKHREWSLKDIMLHMGGLYNIENSVAAVAVAKYLEIDDDKIRSAVGSFKGVRRRFEFVLRNQDHILIDDYAHHPEELKALINGIRSLFKDEKCTVIFQPHLFSRTRDLAEEFAQSLDMADEVILLPIYPARELPIEGVNSELILNQMQLGDKQVLNKEEILGWVKEHQPKLVVMCGAGDIDTLTEPVKQVLLESMN